MPDDDRPRRRRVGRDPLQAARSADSMTGEPPDFFPDVWGGGCNSVVVMRLDPHDPRLLGRTEPDRKHGPERDRHLPEDVPRVALTDNALDPVDELDRLDATREHGEERPLATLMHRVLTRFEADIGRHPGEALAVSHAESRKHGDASDLLRRHHLRHRRLAPVPLQTIGG